MHDGPKLIIEKIGLFKAISFLVYFILNSVLKYFYRPNHTGALDYGLLEAIFFPTDIDRWYRNIYIQRQIQKISSKNSSILDVGSGSGGVSGFLRPIYRTYRFFSLDIKKDLIKDQKDHNQIVGDGCRLPFKDKAFDIVVSLDTVEHLQKSIRNIFYAELKRVCRKSVMLTCPLQSKDGEFQGRTYDLAFQNLYEKEFGLKEPFTAEHIVAEHPTLEEIREALPDSVVTGFKNGDTWLRYMLFSRKPLIGLLSGILYYLFWKKNDFTSPFWGAIIVEDL